MKTVELEILKLEGVEKVKAIKAGENNSLINYDWFLSQLEDSFKHDKIEGGKWLCGVVDYSKEIFPYAEKVDGNGKKKQINPLKNVVRGLNVRFQACYDTTDRISTHKNKNTLIVPGKPAKNRPTTGKLASACIQLATIVNPVELRKLIQVAALQNHVIRKAEKLALKEAKEAMTQRVNAELYDRAVTIAQRQKLDVFTQTGKISKAGAPVVLGIMTGLKADFA